MVVGRWTWAVPMVAAAAVMMSVGSSAWAQGDDETCLECHSGGALDDPSLNVDPKVIAGSVHGEAGLSCTDCHADLADVTEFPHEPAGPPSCTGCHDDVAETLSHSAHRHGVKDAPDCWSCHGGHDVLPPDDPDSRVAPLNQPDTCLACHTNPEFTKEHGLACLDTVHQYKMSAHYRAVVAGNDMAPTCTTCHGDHDILSKNDPNSPTSRLNQADTCGTCHSDVQEQYDRSVHGTALRAGNPDVPNCIDCHRERAVLPPSDPNSPVSSGHIAQTCSRCHDNEALATKYGLPSDRMATYMGSFHGVANRFGEYTVANCASCHGSHDILPSDDPRSSINSKNLPRTCGKCHPQAGEHFASGKIHARPTRGDEFWAWLVRQFYLTMICSVIGVFLLFILVDLWWRFRRRWAVSGGRS